MGATARGEQFTGNDSAEHPGVFARPVLGRDASKSMFNLSSLDPIG
jgi:hypothetical protein